MKATTSDKVGWIAAAVLVIAAIIIMLWPSLWKLGKKNDAGAEGGAGPPTRGVAPAALNPIGVPAEAGMSVNGDTSPGAVAEVIPEPAPAPAPQPRVRRTLDEDEIIII